MSTTPVPLQLTSLVNVSASQQQERCDGEPAYHPEDSYQTLQRLCTRRPSTTTDTTIASSSDYVHHGSIETLWQRRRDGTGWRVVVQSGLDDGRVLDQQHTNARARKTTSTTHASFVIPQDAAAVSTYGGDWQPNPALVWTSFATDTTRDPAPHTVLCVLVHPTTLVLYDVYPDQSATTILTGGEGYTISLPFECAGLYSLDQVGGLFLQRMPDAEDTQIDGPHHHDEYDHNDDTHEQTLPHTVDDGFILQAPPRRHRNPPRFPNDELDDSVSPRISRQSPRPAPHTSPHTPSWLPHLPPVASLFTLQHPLADVLPVRQVSTSSVLHNNLVTDVHETVLWVGTAKWSDDNNITRNSSSPQAQKQVLMVTFHQVHQRHAVWVVREAPPAPSQTIPLHQMSHAWHQTNHTAQEWEVGGDDVDLWLESVESAAGTGLPVGGNAVHLPPTVSRDQALAEALGVRRTPRQAIDAAVNTSAARSRPRTNDPRLAPNSSFLSPHNRSTLSVTQETSILHESNGRSPGGNAVASSPFASMEPKIAVECVYREEPSAVRVPATSVFLASNVSGSGTLTLCLLAASSTDTQELSLLALQPNAQDGFQVTLIERRACSGAQPIQSTPVPACFAPPMVNRRTEMATDILVADPDGALVLYRANLPIASVTAPYRGPVVNVQDGLGDRVSIVFGDGGGQQIVRATLSLALESSPLTRDALAVWDAALFPRPENQAFAFALRADTVRLAQALATEATGRVRCDMAWTAFAAVFEHIVELALWGTRSETNPSAKVQSTTSWEALVGSDYHRQYKDQDQGLLFKTTTPSITLSRDDAPRALLDSISSLAATVLRSRENGLPIVPPLFDALLFLYEENKLSVAHRAKRLVPLSKLLGYVCHAFSQAEKMTPTSPFLEFLATDVGTEVLSCTNTIFPQSAPNNISFTSLPLPPSILTWIGLRIDGKTERGSIFESISGRNAACHRSRSMVRVYQALFNDDSEHAELSVVRILLEEGYGNAAMLRDEMPVGVVLPVLEVLKRCRADEKLLDTASAWSPEAWLLIGREDLSMNASGRRFSPPPAHASQAAIPSFHKDESDETEAPSTDDDADGLQNLEIVSSVLFPADNRIREAARLLRSSKPAFLRVPRAIEVSDHEYEKKKQAKLLLHSRRVLALPIGRGMLTIGSLEPTGAEPLRVPELCFKARIPPTNAVLALDTSECPADLKVWPDFHNGVAAGLRLPLSDDGSSTNRLITRTWIIYNRPSKPTVTSTEDSNTEGSIIHDSKTHGHGGFLLALGFRGHLTALEMSDIYEYLTQGAVTTTVGVLMGLAANKRGTCDMAVSKMLCLHIPSLIPQHFSAIDVASAVQAAAVTGAGLLFQRSSHRMMTEFLLNEIGKRPDSDMSVSDREAYTLSCGIALGMVNLCLGEDSRDVERAAGISDLRVEERLYRYMLGGIDHDESQRTRESNERFSASDTNDNGDIEKCSVVFEGLSINTDVTAPGATIALGLMYMKTGNRTVASAMALPQTHFLLEFVRPDFLTLRILSRALILWADVTPTNNWIESQMPIVVARAYKEMQTAAQNSMDGLSQKPRRPIEYDRHAVRQIYTHVLAGACFSIGLRYAGTGDQKAKAVLTERIFELNGMREGANAVATACRPDLAILETCLGLASISLAIVLAGTGDLDALRLFKVIRWRVDESTNYGNHMIYAMSIGILFLGGGTSTLGREPEDIAALVSAFFPRFPDSSSDNRCHLQALRHLYALAVKKREIVSLDVDSGERVCVPIQVFSQSPHIKTPFLLMNTEDSILSVRVVSDSYYPLRLNLVDTHRYSFFVKKRNFGNASHTSELSVAMKAGGSFSSVFARQFLSSRAKNGSDLHHVSNVWNDLGSRSSQDTLMICLSLCIASVSHKSFEVSHGMEQRDLGLVRKYYQKFPGEADTILDLHFLARLMETSERISAGTKLTL